MIVSSSGTFKGPLRAGKGSHPIKHRPFSFGILEHGLFLVYFFLAYFLGDGEEFVGVAPDGGHEVVVGGEDADAA